MSGWPTTGQLYQSVQTRISCEVWGSSVQAVPQLDSSSPLKKMLSLLPILNLQTSCFNLHLQTLYENDSVPLMTSPGVLEGCSSVPPEASFLLRGNSSVCCQASFESLQLQAFLHPKTMRSLLTPSALN